MSGAALVGQFPGTEVFRRAMRAPVNPLDKSTIVSVFPKEIIEVKHTIQPGKFTIPAGSIAKPSLLVVGPSSWWREVDEDQPLLEIPIYSIHIAESVIKDYCNGLLGFNAEAASPGLFYIPGEHIIDDVRSKYATELKKAVDRQKAWYNNLIRLADSLWARSNNNPLTISDDMRMAATELGVQGTKDWMKSFQSIGQVRCVACGTLKNPEFPICASCRHIDMSHPKAKELKFAQ